MIARTVALVFFVSLFGCGGTFYHRNLADPENPGSQGALDQILEAKKQILAGQNDLACERFKKLSLDEKLPVRDWCLLQAHQTCPINDGALLPLSTLKPESYRWFENDIIKSKLKHWEQLSDSDQIALLWDQGRLEKNEKQRELFYLQALDLAQKKNSALLTIAQEKLWNNSPRLQKKHDGLPLTMLKKISADLRRWREFSESIELEQKILKTLPISEKERFDLLQSIRQTYKTAQNKPEMMKATKALLKMAENSFYRKKDPAKATQLLNARVLAARTWWTEGDRKQALNWLNKTEKELRGIVSLEEVYWLKGRIYDEMKNNSFALKTYGLALGEKATGLRDKVLWFEAWTFYKQNNCAKASQAFHELSQLEGPDKMKALYWKARCENSPEEKRKAFLELRQLDPIGYYGLLTYRELNEQIPSLKQRTPALGHDGPSLLGSSDIPATLGSMAEWLIAIEQPTEATRVLEEIRQNLEKNTSEKSVANISPETSLRLASAYARAGEYLPLFSFLGTLEATRRDQLVTAHPELLFPQLWLKEVQAAAAKTKAPQELIYSIMRQESAFNPRARSGAEAYGLMQLLPSVAKVHAQKRAIPLQNPEDLYQPEIAIPLGASEIRAMLDEWKNSWIPAVASYNASKTAVQGWLRARHRADPIEFIEEIPYEETKTYVKLVLRNQIFYGRLLESEPQSFPALDLPASK